MKELKFSVCLPTYNMGPLLGATIENILNQTFQNFELIISDNCSQDETERIVKSFSDPRIKYFRNDINLGYFGNLEQCMRLASGEIIFLMSAKSLLSKDALFRTNQAFHICEDVGAVTRPYYWFGQSFSVPVRIKARYAKENDLVVSLDSDLKDIIAVFHTLDNPAGLAFRRQYMDVGFHRDAFVEFTYPFASILKKHKVVLLKDYIMACPALEYSGSQNPAVYEKSPVQCWVDLFCGIFNDDGRCISVQKGCVENFVATNYIGLVQIRNYARRYTYLLREIALLLRYRWKNIYNFQFWFYSLGTMLMPRKILKFLVKEYKKKVSAKILEGHLDEICLKL
ncbi:MAG: glycosyltransferase family 2 protein [Candidatus Omnitrophota bacterium]